MNDVVRKSPEPYVAVTDYPRAIPRRTFLMSWAGVAWGTFAVTSALAFWRCSGTCSRTCSSSLRGCSRRDDSRTMDGTFRTAQGIPENMDREDAQGLEREAPARRSGYDVHPPGLYAERPRDGTQD